MTAGKGIAHAEITPQKNSGQLNGVQLWVALPDEYRKMEPSFLGIQEVPKMEFHGGVIRLFAGSFDNATSPGKFYSDIIGIDMLVHPEEQVEISLNSEFEHAALVLEGDCTFEDQTLETKTLYYLKPGRSSVAIESREGCRLLLIGGTPFPEKILMWWNFVSRTPDEIARAKSDWEETDRFGKVRGTYKSRLSAPTLSRFAAPNPAS